MTTLEPEQPTPGIGWSLPEQVRDSRFACSFVVIGAVQDRAARAADCSSPLYSPRSASAVTMLA